MQIYSSYGSKEREPLGEKERGSEGGKNEKQGASHRKRMNGKVKHGIKNNNRATEKSKAVVQEF